MAPTTQHRLARLPDLSDVLTRRRLKPRPHPYWYPLATGRFLGYSRTPCIPAQWLARYRRKNGKYCQVRLGGPDDQRPANGRSVLSFQQACQAAELFFRKPEVASDAGDPNPIGRMDGLLYCPVGPVYTLAHALLEYLEWKRLRSAETHYDVIVSMINYHILPRLGPLCLDELRGEQFREYFREVMETPPKHGNRPAGRDGHCRVGIAKRCASERRP